ncbi:hypothetical protein KUTeg_019940 [Tegillarca granosa]|uniref:Guanylate cyclase domain-containing protein n=1 Tax=Tegillarca granosa TaxID=220873 RepID=A0ABQ9EDY2_TEGGR|nr:hypothetical protein KUTeg_019940 [Tegillarca granosa]
MEQKSACLRTFPKVKIGMDIGFALSGTVGSRLPKCAVFGSVIENVRNLARTSKPSKIHISSAFWEKIKCEEVSALSAEVCFYCIKNIFE